MPPRRCRRGPGLWGEGELELDGGELSEGALLPAPVGGVFDPARCRSPATTPVHDVLVEVRRTIPPALSTTAVTRRIDPADRLVAVEETSFPSGGWRWSSASGPQRSCRRPVPAEAAPGAPPENGRGSTKRSAHATHRSSGSSPSAPRPPQVSSQGGHGGVWDPSLELKSVADLLRCASVARRERMLDRANHLGLVGGDVLELGWGLRSGHWRRQRRSADADRSRPRRGQ